jgi:hypothetical protein
MSVGIEIRNNTDVDILVRVSWGYSNITSKQINKGDSEKLNKGIGYVFYDLTFINAKTNGMLLRKNGVYGSSSWIFKGEVGQYSLEKN